MYKHTVKSKLSQARSTPPFAAAAATPLGAGKKFFSHIRHKIEDNLTPRLSGRLYYKGSKHTRSMSTLSLAGGDGTDGGCVGGKYTPTRTAAEDVETPMPAAMSVPAKVATTMTICSYVDSDEEESPLSLSLTHQSLEDEIFAELEKVAHDESKLNEVLQSFDQILQEYPATEEYPVQEELQKVDYQSVEQSVEQLEVPPPAQFSDHHKPKLSKSYSTLGSSSSTRQLYQTPELAQAKLLRRCSSGSRYSSLCELSQISGSRIPISKHSSLRSLDRSKQQQQGQLEQNKVNKQQQQQPPHPKRQQQQQLRTRSLLTLNTNGSQVAAAAAAKVRSTPRAHSTLERRPLSRRGRSANAHSDELLVKCLAKGHELLRKVENLNGGKAVRPSRGVSKKRQLHKQLQFASEEKVGKPKLESCKIIPPKLGETSDKNHELLVKVVQQQQLTKKSLEQSVSDSDDSGHISNAAMHSSASSNSSSSALNSTSNSTGSLCESEGDVEVELQLERDRDREVEPSTEQETMLLGRPNKIAELLEKFEAKSKKGQLRVVSKMQAQVQAVRCIQTQVEIYPTYTKEVTMRLH